VLRTRGSRSIAAAAFAVVMTLTSLATADAATVTSSDWSAQWTTVRLQGDQRIEQPDEASGTGPGGQTIGVTLPKGSSITGSTSVDFDKSQGKVRSSTTLDMNVNESADPDLSWQRAFVVTVNQLTVSDQLTVDQDGFGFIKITLRTTGTLMHRGEILDAPDAFSEIEQYNRVMLDASLTNGESTSLREEIRSRYNGRSDNVFSASENRPVDHVAELIVTWLDAQPAGFDLTYSEVMSFSLISLDGDAVRLHGDNQFGSTLQLYADVYDASGQWMPGVTVRSSNGIFYPNLGPTPSGTVPEPSSLALALGAGLGLLWRQRRGEVPEPDGLIVRSHESEST
jgi:hypothetical protein